MGLCQFLEHICRLRSEDGSVGLGLLVQLNVDEVLIVCRCICCVIILVSCVAEPWSHGASCDAACRVVELVHVRSDVRRELCEVDAPVDDFGVRVAECASGADCG